MKTYDLSEDPGGVEAEQLAQRRRLAELLMAQSTGPVYSHKAGIAKMLTNILGQMDVADVERKERDLAGRRDAERRGEFDKVVEMATMSPTVGPGQVQKDDDGNDMPGNMNATAERRMQLAKMLAGSRNPAVQQIALGQIFAKPKEDEEYTLTEGAKRFKGGQLVAENAKAEATHKRGDTRKIVLGNDEVVQEWTGKEWQEIGRGGRFAPQQPDRSLVEVQDPRNPNATILVPRDQAAGKAGAGSVAGARQSREDVDSLRKEFNSLDAVKNYTSVKPIIEAARKAPDTPQGDFALIYGVGKALDPNSVVREGEMNLVIASGSPAQRVSGFLAQLQGKGRLTPDMRRELQTVLDQRAAEYEKGYSGARQTYEGISKQRGYDPSQIFMQMGNERRQVVRTGTLNGRKVVQYSDGTTDYAP